MVAHLTLGQAHLEAFHRSHYAFAAYRHRATPVLYRMGASEGLVVGCVDARIQQIVQWYSFRDLQFCRGSVVTVFY